MTRGLTRMGLGDVGSNERFVKLAREYGFQAVDLNDVLGWVEAEGKETALAVLAETGVAIGSIGLPVEWRSTEERFRSDLTKLAATAAAAAELGCTRCCTYVLPATDLNAAHFMALATRRLRTCADILGAYGIRFGLEYVGPHHLRTRWANPFVWTLDQTNDWIDAIGAPNVGLLLDSYHWYTTGQTADELAALRADQIVHVHINDAPDVPVEEALDNGRLYPGEGVIDLPAFLQALQRTGYSGPISQEILTQSPPTAPAEELLSRSKAGFDKVFAAAGL
ncbi:sugar phosphate isomerase/epimerase family protein [Paenibacillus koleovorans]|uniref:sugar phosphate isomerase/epimerase family protein n=1 Tax=Paenibacillus koleovorans TaxID=121608 RepID=UPI000FDBF05D|nr:sugar phosphate isomerase/epimerase family protein [Paenibacillus koleovorans]